MSDPITDNERGIITMVRLNRAEKKIEMIKKITIGDLRITYEWRSKKNLWGRFGGGWNWKLGIIAGAGTVILELLVFSIRFDTVKR